MRDCLFIVGIFVHLSCQYLVGNCCGKCFYCCFKMVSFAVNIKSQCHHNNVETTHDFSGDLTVLLMPFGIVSGKNCSGIPEESFIYEV